VELSQAFYAGVVLFIAYLVRGIAGFGSGLIAVPLLALRFPVTIVVPIVVLLDYLGSASQGLKNREHIAWQEQLPLIPFTLVGVGAGLFLLKAIEPSILRKMLGIFVMFYAVYQLLPLPPLRGSRIFIVPCGLLGGFVGTLFGTGGPFYVMYFALRDLSRSVFRATFALNFLIDGAIRLSAYVTTGFFHRELLFFLLAALPVAALALFIGGHVQTRFSQQDFARFISILLLGSGLALLFK
jgi:uncharacterized membrane protein YfcA